MEEDFDGDMCSISEDSGAEEDEEEDDEEPQIDSQMGDAGEKKEAVCEKAWDDKEDENPDTSEKYESGSSVKETDPSSKELRAKDDNALGVDESERLDENEAPEETQEENHAGGVNNFNKSLIAYLIQLCNQKYISFCTFCFEAFCVEFPSLL